MGAATPAAWAAWTSAFVRRLEELGWIDGKTIRIEYRWAEGSEERYAEMGAEFVKLDASVLVAVGGEAAKKATSKIPIVVALMADPVGSGLVASLARPGGNITGLATSLDDTVPKQLELLMEAVPHLASIGILANSSSPNYASVARNLFAATQARGLNVAMADVRTAEEFDTAFARLKGENVQALMLGSNVLFNLNRVRIAEFAIKNRLPSVFGVREYVEAGGLMSYGESFRDFFRRSAGYVDKIIRGARAGDLPIEQPNRFYFTINLKTAKAIGLEISPSLLARADEVIE
jgi:putative ABC transport system substrate-binding protein